MFIDLEKLIYHVKRSMENIKKENKFIDNVHRS